jgi:hypothetical protein
LAAGQQVIGVQGGRMTREEIRQELMNFLRQSLREQSRPGSIQLMGVYDHFQSKVGHQAIGSVHPIAREILQELVNNNVLFIGCGDREGFPWFTLTAYGKSCIEEGNLLPLDPDRYLATLSARVSGLDSLSLQYLQEAISTYNRGFYLSSAVSLGIASEHLLLKLIDSYVNAHSDPAKKNQAEKRFEGKFIYTQYAQFKKELSIIKESIPSQLLRDYETHLDGIFNLIRLVRNQSGHPSGIFPDQAIVMAHLQAFSFFAARVTGLEAHFASTAI